MKRGSDTRLLQEAQKLKGVEWNITAADIGIFVFNRSQQLNNLQSSQHLSDGQLHAIRKMLKKIWYVLEFHYLMKSNTRSASFEERYSNMALFILMTDLGNYHDDCISILVLEKHLMENKFSQKGRVALAAILEERKTKQQQFKERLNDQFCTCSFSDIQHFTTSVL